MYRSQIGAHVKERFFVVVQKLAQREIGLFLDTNDLLTEGRHCFNDCRAKLPFNAINEWVAGNLSGEARSLLRRRRFFAGRLLALSRSPGRNGLGRRWGCRGLRRIGFGGLRLGISRLPRICLIRFPSTAVLVVI